MEKISQRSLFIPITGIRVVLAPVIFFVEPAEFSCSCTAITASISELAVSAYIYLIYAEIPHIRV
jgi:hypothetical protein